jgi:hypothetical protein
MKKLTTILLILCIVASGLLAQDCPSPNITLSTQEEIDQFPIYYPDCEYIEGSLNISGENIVNLQGLANIKYVGHSLSIKNTALSDLSGLDSLEVVSIRLTIRENPNLQSLNALEQLNTQALNYLDIAYCPALSYCQLENICQYLSDYGYYTIGHNGEGCKSRDLIIQHCNIPPDTIPRVLCDYDGFENWDEYGVPEDWEGDLQYHDNQYNIEIYPFLSEGEHSVLLRTNIWGFEGPLAADIQKEICANTGLIDVSFTYKCIGEGNCRFIIGQRTEGSIGANKRVIWYVEASDSNQYTITLPNIAVNPPFHTVQYISLEAAPYSTGVGTYGYCEFIIDDLTVNIPDYTSSIEEKQENTASIFPNPAQDVLYIESDIIFDNISLMDNLGQIHEVDPTNDHIDLEWLRPGMYYITFVKGSKRVYRKFVKI